MTLPIHVIVVGRNHGEYTRECLESVLSQDYERFHITWLDDCSDPPDRAVGIAIEMLNVTDKAWKGQGVIPTHKIIQRTHREGGLFNIYKLAIMTPPQEIVFFMGGDDKLTREDALSIIADQYEDPECWYTHGASWCSDNAGAFSAPALHDDFRSHPFYWLPSSWRSELTRKVYEDDLKMGGWWFQTAGDVALYTPILEMCGLSRIRYIDQTIYLYRKHDQQDGALDQRYQDFCGWIARSKPRYSRLASLDASPTRTPHEMKFGLAFTPQLPHSTPITAKVEGTKVTIGPY